MMMNFPRLLNSLVVFGLCWGVASPMLLFAQDPLFKLEPAIKLPGLDGPGKPEGKIIDVALKPHGESATDLKPGDEVTLAITIHVPENSYTYSQTTPKGSPTQISIEKLADLEAVDEKFQPARKPKRSFDPIFEGDVEKFDKPITWTRKYRLTENAKPADVSVKGKVRVQICDESTCRFETDNFDVALVKASATEAVAQTKRPALGRNPGPAEITVKLTPQDAKPGDKVTLTIEMKMDEGWHTYSITQKKVIGAQATKIDIEKLQNLKPVGEGFQSSHPFEEKEVDVGVSVVRHEVHHDTIVWSRPYEVTSDAEQKGFGVEGILNYQICDASKCVPEKFSFDLSTDSARMAQESAPRETVSKAEGETAAVLTSREARLKALLGEPTADQEETVKETNGTKDEGKGFWLFVTTAVLAGFAALLTPCVYPMVPITISFFTKQAEKEHHRPTTLALVYCGGIMATFTILGLLISVFFQATALNQLANNIWLNLLLTVVIAFFGISMLGVFEIRVPSWLLTWSAGKESKGGIVGTLFMALTFTLVSFTCTFAFAGGLLVMASKGEYFWPIVGMLAFSGAFAFPFFLLALFPKMLSKMPKSGGWMNIMKVTMGFVEIGAALKFLSVADAVYFGQPTVLTHNVVMALWLVLGLLAGLYPLGLYRMPHDTPGKFTAGRLAFAAPFLALAALLGAGLFTSIQPSGWIWDNIVAFAPPKFETQDETETEKTETATADIGPYVEHDELTYALDFFEALEHARKTKQPLFLDITGQNCVNCRLMENRVFPRPENRELLKKFVRVKLFTDQIPMIEDATERKDLINLNQKIQLATNKSVALPGYVVLNPFDVGAEGKLNMLSWYEGMEENEGEFTKFLNQGLEKWQKQSSEEAVQSASTDGMGQAVTQN